MKNESNQSVNASIDKLFEGFEGIVQEKKASTKKIDYWIRMITIGTTFLSLLVAASSLLNSQIFYNIVFTMIVVITSVTLIIAVCRISHLIQSLKTAYPNERYTDFHYCTFIFYLFLFVPSTILTLKTGIG